MIQTSMKNILILEVAQINSIKAGRTSPSADSTQGMAQQSAPNHFM